MSNIERHIAHLFNRCNKGCRGDLACRDSGRQEVLAPYWVHRLAYHVPRPIYWWYADHFAGNDGWRPLGYRERND